jgi:hypothetical protein
VFSNVSVKMVPSSEIPQRRSLDHDNSQYTLLWGNPYLLLDFLIFIMDPAHIEYRIEILASQGIPIIELENSYLEYS